MIKVIEGIYEDGVVKPVSGFEGTGKKVLILVFPVTKNKSKRYRLIGSIKLGKTKLSSRRVKKYEDELYLSRCKLYSKRSHKL